MTNAKQQATRQYVQAERRLLSEWIAQKHANERVLMHVYVGAVTPLQVAGTYSVKEFNMLGVRRRWADAIIVYPDRAEIVEAKMVTEVDVIGQLQLYLKLFPYTSDLGEIAKLPVSGLVLSAVTDPQLTSMLREFGLREETFTPPWVADYFSGREPRHRKPGTLGFPFAT